MSGVRVPMTLPRVVAPETLDGLPESDPAAVRSRRDLQRIHRFMGTRGIVSRALHGWARDWPAGVPMRVLELGAGDGTLLLGVARSAAGAWPPVELTLLDRQSLVAPATLAGFADLGWRATVCTVDALDWAAGAAASPSAADRHAAQGARAGLSRHPALPASRDTAAAPRWDVIVANLFVHHFEGAALSLLLAGVAARADRFFACEPRRGWLALGASHLVGVIGANAVTREDAVLSVHAGFCGAELSAAWPAPPGTWQLEETPAALFSHCLRAVRTDLPQPPEGTTVVQRAAA